MRIALVVVVVAAMIGIVPVNAAEEIKPGQVMEVALSNGGILSIVSEEEIILNGGPFVDKYDGQVFAPSYYGAARHLHYKLNPRKKLPKKVEEHIKVVEVHPYWSGLPQDRREFRISVKLNRENGSAIWRDVQAIGDTIPAPANATLNISQDWLVDGEVVASLKIIQSPVGIKLFLVQPVSAVQIASR